MPTYLTPGVYIEETESGARPIEGVATAVAAFVGFAAQGPVNTPTLVSNWAQFTTIFGDFIEDSYLAHSVYGWFMNGGGNCYIVRVGAEAGGSDTPAALPQAALGRYVVHAKPLPAGANGKHSAAPGTANAGAGASHDDISVEVVPPEQPDAPEDTFTLVVRRGNKVEETFPGVTTKRGKENVVTVVRERSNLIVLEETTGGSLARPQTGAVVLTVPPPVPTDIGANDYVGDTAARTGFGGLETIDEVTMVMVPDLMSAFERGMVDLESVKAVQLAMIAHCELMGDRMAILDPPPGLNVQEVRHWRQEVAGYDSKFATMYYPWIKVFDPASGTNKMVPPAGHVAGVWGRNDATRGVHKAPANEVIRGAVSLGLNLTKIEQELLNPIGVNCIRAFPGRGIRIWGARTLSSDPAWRYVNVRRLFNYLEKSILNGTQWVVFEPNDDTLWARIRRTLSSFLVNEWRKGALFGLSADEAYFVKCDRETNPAEQIDAGMVVCEVGVAPVKPAEFVIFRLSQLSSGTSSVAE